MEFMKQCANMHALKALIKPIELPDASLGVANDERLKDVPLLIFTEQHLPSVAPEIEKAKNLSYENVQLDGAGASLSLDYFSTDNFSIGNPY